jgi:tRNA(Arg) A34 adenosine deaminase TadA
MRKPRKKYRLKATIYDKKGKVLSVGENSYYKTHPFHVRMAHKYGRDGQIFLHAETAALVKLKRHHCPHRIYIERYSENGEPLLAKPCPVCEGALKEAGIKIIEHT